MKTPFICLLAALLVLSCKTENLQNSLAIGPNMAFSSVTPSAKINSTIELKYDGNNVTATRSQSNIIEGETKNNILYFATKSVSISDGLVQLNGSEKSKVWFIPFFVGADPVEISGKQCIKYICACGGFPGQNASGCCAANDQITYIDCGLTNCDQPICQSTCLGYAVYVDCTTQNSIEWYSGGVIVEAEKVDVVDPAWYHPGPPPIQLKVKQGEEVNISLKDYNVKKD